MSDRGRGMEGNRQDDSVTEFGRMKAKFRDVRTPDVALRGMSLDLI